MNTLRSLAISTFSGFVLSTTAVQGQTVEVNPGDLLLGFFQLNSEGVGVEANTCIVNLGPGSTWRENTATTVAFGNINADLQNAFGAGWFDNPNVRCGIVGVVGATEPATNGDPSRTTYYSQGASAFTPGSTTPVTLSSSQRGSLSTKLLTFKGATNGRPSGTNAAAAVIGTSENSNFASFQPPLATTYFGIGASPLASFGAGTIGSAEGYNVEAALDVYRILHSTNGADLTAGLSTGDATVGQGQYIGTFTIDSAGEVRLDTPAAGPVEGYAAWADTNALSGAELDAGADPDKDGIANGIEFVIGGNPKANSDLTKLPVVTIAEGVTEFYFRRADAASYASPSVQKSTDLSNWANVVNGVDGITITEEDNFYDASTDKITVRMPT
ncbi:MAG: hypothetical protein R3F19_21445 [Verrucomicrobiales bacterium]